MTCSLCVILRRRWYAVCKQMEAGGVPLPLDQLEKIRHERNTLEYQTALDALRRHLEYHRQKADAERLVLSDDPDLRRRGELLLTNLEKML